MKGVKGSSYKIKNRSNVAYKLIKTDLDKLTGTFDSNATIDLTYGYSEKGVAVESVRFIRNEIHALPRKEVRLTYFIEPVRAENKDVKFEVLDGNAKVLRGTTVTSSTVGESTIKMTSLADESKSDILKFVVQPNEVSLDDLKVYNEYVVRNEWSPILVQFIPENTTDNLFIVNVNTPDVETRNRNGRYEVKVTSDVKELDVSIMTLAKTYPQAPIPVIEEFPNSEE